MVEWVSVRSGLGVKRLAAAALTAMCRSEVDFRSGGGPSGNFSCCGFCPYKRE